MKNDIAGTAFNAEIVKEYFGDRSVTLSEANIVESVFRRGMKDGDSLSVETLMELAVLHVLAGNRDRALAIADEIAGRPNSKDLEGVASIYLAAGLLFKSKATIVSYLFRNGCTQISHEDASNGDAEDVAEYVALAIMESIDDAPIRNEALVSLAEWLCLAQNKDPRIYDRLVIPTAILAELLTYDPYKHISVLELMGKINEEMPSLLPYMIKLGESVWYCGPDLAGEQNENARKFLNDVGFRFRPLGCRIAAGEAIHWFSHRFEWKTKKEIAVNWIEWGRDWSEYLANWGSGESHAGSWEHTLELPEHLRACADADEGWWSISGYEVIWFARLHIQFGSPARVCELYKNYLFKKPHATSSLSSLTLVYFDMLLKVKNVNAAWIEYQSYQLTYLDSEPHFLDLSLLFARKFIENGNESMAKGLLNDLLGRSIAVQFTDRAKNAIGLLMLCEDDPKLRQGIKEWQANLKAPN
jgi:hypothetical protein